MQANFSMNPKKQSESLQKRLDQLEKNFLIITLRKAPQNGNNKKTKAHSLSPRAGKNFFKTFINGKNALKYLLFQKAGKIGDKKTIDSLETIFNIKVRQNNSQQKQKQPPKQDIIEIDDEDYENNKNNEKLKNNKKQEEDEYNDFFIIK